MTQKRVVSRHSFAVVVMMVLQYMLVILPIVVLLISPTEAEAGSDDQSIDHTVDAINASEPADTVPFVETTVTDLNIQDFSKATPVVMIETAIDAIDENISPLLDTVSWGEHFACCM